MTETAEARNAGFVAYEYKNVDIPRHKAPLYSDVYRSLGWIEDDGHDGAASRRRPALALKRNRALGNRDALQQLEASTEQALRTIDRLELSERIRPAAGAWAVGGLGTAFLAGSVFSLLDDLTLLSIVLGAVGIGLWCAAYPTFRAMRNARSAAVKAQLDREYDLIYDNAATAHQLVHQVPPGTVRE